MPDRRRRESATRGRKPGTSAGSGLLYVTYARPGLRRLRAGGGFRYVTARGRHVRSPATLARIRALAVPPAWRDVWICANPRGHLQATGRDARGRKQHRYHAGWRVRRDADKFARMLEFGRALPVVRRRVRRDLTRPGLPPEKVIATVVRLLEQTCIRVGNEEYARANHSYGLTTLHDGHVKIGRGELEFEFRGKLGVRHRCRVHDPRVARIVARCRALPGAELFQYVGLHGHRHRVGSTEVNAWLRDVTGQEFSAKDFRTWAGSLTFAKALRRARPARSAAARKRQVLAALDEAATRLGNTRTVCRTSYVHPGLIAAFEKGTLARDFAPRNGRVHGLASEERALLTVLRRSAGRIHAGRPRGRQ